MSYSLFVCLALWTVCFYLKEENNIKKGNCKIQDPDSHVLNLISKFKLYFYNLTTLLPGGDLGFLAMRRLRRSDRVDLPSKKYIKIYNNSYFDTRMDQMPRQYPVGYKLSGLVEYIRMDVRPDILPDIRLSVRPSTKTRIIH